MTHAQEHALYTLQHQLLYVITVELKYRSDVVIIVADFTEGQAVFQDIEEKLKYLDVGVLVNNVGLSYVHPEYFLEVTKEVHIIITYMKGGLHM